MSAVYDVQCRTWTIAKKLSNIEGNAIRCDIEQELAHPRALFLFRARWMYRTDEASALRKQVADVVRQQRGSK